MELFLLALRCRRRGLGRFSWSVRSLAGQLRLQEVWLLCIQLYNNLYPFSPIPSCVAIPNRPSNRPLSEHKESDQSDRGTPKCARQSNPGLLGRARAPVRLNQNRKLDGTGWCGPHRVNQPIGGSPRNPPVRDRTIGDKWGKAVQENRGNAGRTGICTEDRVTFYRREVFYSMYL